MATSTTQEKEHSIDAETNELQSPTTENAEEIIKKLKDKIKNLEKKLFEEDNCIKDLPTNQQQPNSPEPEVKANNPIPVSANTPIPKRSSRTKIRKLKDDEKKELSRLFKKFNFEKGAKLTIKRIKKYLEVPKLHIIGNGHLEYSHMHLILVFNGTQEEFKSSNFYMCDYCKEPMHNNSLSKHKGWNCKKWSCPFTLEDGTNIDNSKILDHYANNSEKLGFFDDPCLKVKDKNSEYYYCLIDAQNIPKEDRAKELDFKYAKYIFYVGIGTKARPDKHFDIPSDKKSSKKNGNDNEKQSKEIKATQSKIKEIWKEPDNNPVIRCRVGPVNPFDSALMERCLLELLGHDQLTNKRNSQAKLPEGWGFQEMFTNAVFGIRELLKKVGPEENSNKENAYYHWYDLKTRKMKEAERKKERQQQKTPSKKASSKTPATV